MHRCDLSWTTAYLNAPQVAAKTASAFNPNVRIHPIHGNIKEPQFDVSWFRGFDLVLNALDNLGDERSSATTPTRAYDQVP